MALTFTKKASYPIGDRWHTVYVAAADSSYPTGGYSCPPSSLGLGGLSASGDPELEIEIDNTIGYVPHYDYVNLKLKFYSAAGTEVTNATNLSTVNDIRIKTTTKYRG